MRPEHCLTRNHIEAWHGRALPSEPERVELWSVLRSSILPILVWTGVACVTYFGHDPPLVAMVLGGVFALSFIVGFGLRRRARYSVRCSAYGASGGVLGKCMAGF
ncbi:hypothetical protein ACW69C_21875 [Streptomyces sp. MN3]